MPNPDPISEDLGKWNELIGQTWVQCLPVEWEVRSVPPSPHREREELFYRGKSGGGARRKGAPVRHSSGWVQIAGADSLHHILKWEGWTLKSHFSAWAERESQLDFPFPNHFIFLINLLPATPREQLSHKTFPPLLKGVEKNQNTFACYLKHLKPMSYLCHCTAFSFQCW